jgi:poly-gamma-glutamate synthesis protein (capsule biosynthesis protein)
MYGSKYLGYIELASENKFGVNPLDIDQVVTDIKKYKQIYDYVIVMPHWGREYRYYPLPECKDMAYKMVDAGADAIIASHAHNIQPMIQYKGKWVYFCLGNFLFPDYYMHPPRPIWYPSNNIEAQLAKRVFGYPDCIDEHVVSVWRGRSRIGIMAKCSLSESIVDLKYDFVGLSEDNILDFYNCFNAKMKRIRMWCFGQTIQMHNYEFWIRCYESRWNIPRRLLHFVSRLFKINYDVKVNL